jgi:two-component system NarL family sensor kinase
VHAPGHTQPRFTIRVDGAPFELPEAIKTVLFRVAQEALTNIQKHAGASRVDIRLVFSEGSVALQVQDNGRGFDAEAMLRHPSQGLGLRNMRERLGSIDGRLTVQSRPGLTEVVAEVPEAAIARFAAHSP